MPGQVLGEFYNVLTKRGVSRDEVRGIVLDIISASRVLPASDITYAAALSLAADHKLQFWDALILTASAEAECELLLSEDMQDGFATAA